MRWEYKIKYISYYSTEEELNELGMDEWELMYFEVDENAASRKGQRDYPCHWALFKRGLNDSYQDKL